VPPLWYHHIRVDLVVSTVLLPMNRLVLLLPSFLFYPSRRSRHVVVVTVATVAAVAADDDDDDDDYC